MQDTTKQTPEQVIPPRQENVISAGSTITSTMTYNPDTEKYEETVERTIIPVSGTERNVVERIYAEQELAATANYQQQTRFENITGIDVNQDDKIGDGRSYEEKVYRVEDTKTGERSWMRESEYMEKGSKGEVRGVPDLTTGGLYTAPGGYGTRLNLADDKPVASPTFTRFPDNFRGDLAAAQARLDSTVVGGGKKLGTTTIRSQDEASSAQDEFTTVGGTVVPTSMLGEQSVPVEAPLTLTPSGKRQRGFQVEYATLPQMIIGDPESGFKPGQFIEGFGASLGVGDLVYALIQESLFKPVRRYLLRSYQSVLILKPDIEDTREDEALGKIGEFIKENGGVILKTEKWGKKRLAYRVKKNRFGIYLNLYHTLEPSGVIDIEKKYKLYDLIIKFMVVSLTDDELERALGKNDETEEEGDEMEKVSKNYEE